MTEQAKASNVSVALFDGRLDNRTELLQALDRDERSVPPSDSDLALSAYQRWGEEFVNFMVGDFTSVVWDATERRLVLARDALGARPLFFWRSGDVVYFATEPRGLLAQPEIPKTVDEYWIARWLALLPEQGTRTQYQGIERVPRGQLVSHDGSGMRVHRFWRPETLAPLQFKRDDEYIDGLRSVLNEAIRCRVGKSGGVGSHLSGGLDSSAVTALAARQLSASGRRLTAFTAVPERETPDLHPGRFVDEGPLAALTAGAFSNVDHVLVSNLATPVFDAVDATGLAVDGPIRNPFNQIWINAIARTAQNNGISVVLTGQMGNMTISYDGMARLAHLVRVGQWARLANELLALHRGGSRWLGLAAQTFEPFLPVNLRRRLRTALGRPPQDLQDFSAISPTYVRRLGLDEEAHTMAGHIANTELGRYDIRLGVLQRGDNALYHLGIKRQFGVDMLDPTADRRVVEFCLAVPLEQFLRNGETRSLIRRAMAGLVPAPVLNETRKGLQAADWHVGATAARQEMWAELERLERSPLASECLDLPRLRRLMEDWPSGGWHRDSVRMPYQLALARGLATGRFIRRVEGGNA